MSETVQCKPKAGVTLETKILFTFLQSKYKAKSAYLGPSPGMSYYASKVLKRSYL